MCKEIQSGKALEENLPAKYCVPPNVEEMEKEDVGQAAGNMEDVLEMREIHARVVYGSAGLSGKFRPPKHLGCS